MLHKISRLVHIRSAICLMLLLILVSRSGIHAQDLRYDISGKVIDLEDGEPLPGAEIFIHELVTGTVSDVDGNFTFTNLKPARYHIHIKYIGHESIFEYLKLDQDIKNLIFRMQPSSLELKEIIVESDPFKTGPVEKSLTIATVTSGFLQKNPGGTLMNSLEKLPGINSINLGVGIAKPVIRGLSFNRVIVADRGIKQEGQQWGADHGLEIDQFDPEQVEILKGPASLLYGSDAMGGVIVINQPYLAETNSLDGELIGIYKSNNHLVGLSGMVRGNRAGKVFQLRFSGQDFGDYQVPADNFTYNGYVLPIENQTLINTAGSELNFSGMFGLKKEWGFSTVTLSNYHQQAGLFPGAVGVPRAYQLEDDGDNRNIDYPRQIINHFKVISNSNILIGNNWLEMNLGFQHNDRDEEGLPHVHGYAPTPDGNLALGLDLYTLTANARYNQVINEREKRIFGLQYQYQDNNFAGFEFLLPAFTTNAVGVFIHEQHDIGETFSLNGGLRFDYGDWNIIEHFEPDFSTENPNDSTLRNPAISENFYNVSGALGLSFYPSHYLNLKLNLGSSFRMPTAAELSMNGVHHGTFRHERGDPSLTSERGWQVDFNLNYHRHDFIVSLTPFFNLYKDYIYLKPTTEFSELPGGGQVFQYTQNDAIYTGGELVFDYHFFKDIHLEVNMEYVWNLNLDTELPLPFTPPFSVMGEIEYRIPLSTEIMKKSYFQFGTRYTAPQNRVDRNEKATDGYFLLFMGAGTDVIINEQRIKLILNVQNLLNTSYMNHLSRYRWLNLPEQGRNISLSIVVPFLAKGKAG
jgi:iron complex outermembrane recepter protein